MATSTMTVPGFMALTVCAEIIWCGRARNKTVVSRCPGRNGALQIGRPIQPPTLLWPKPLDLRLERGFDRPVRRLNGDHARAGIGDKASLADALDLRTLLREFASAQD